MHEKEIQDSVLYRDGLMLVIDKPAGIACHQGPSGGDFIEKYFKYLQYGLPRPPSLAHRLDRDTSGCLILGRHRKALAKLGKLFEQGKIGKKYWAICYGRPPEDSGLINAALLKVNTKRGWRIVVDEKEGQQSATEYKLMKYDAQNDISWIEASPLTGRTHQIRIHLKHIGCAIVGDLFYGRGDKDAETDLTNETEILNLHARQVEIPIYKSREAVVVIAPPPPHMIKKLEAMGFKKDPKIDIVEIKRNEKGERI